MKRKIIISCIMIIMLLELVLLINGITIPEQIGIITTKTYVTLHYPKMKLKYKDIEWSSAWGAYAVGFTDKNDKRKGLMVYPKYFPIFIGEGTFQLDEEYRKMYK